MAFVSVADTLHFGHAAERLGIAQPAVSQLIRRLEGQLDLILFERTSHRVALTPAGQALLPEARSAVATLERLSSRATELREGTTATLRIATTTGNGARLADVLRRYRRHHPGVELDLQVRPTRAKLDGVAAGALDVAFLRSEPPDAQGLSRRVAWTDRYVAVVPTHAAGRDGSGRQAMASLPLMIVARVHHPAMHDELLGVCRSLGTEPQVRDALATPQETLAIVATGAAWTLFFEGNVPELPGITVCALPDGTPPSRVWVVWRSAGMPAHVRDFLELVATGEG
jgi:DNA-binding transcriptional LysR family regulator